MGKEAVGAAGARIDAAAEAGAAGAQKRAGLGDGFGGSWGTAICRMLCVLGASVLLPTPSRNASPHTTHLQLCRRPPPTFSPPPSHPRCAGLVQLGPCGTRAAAATAEPGGRANNTTPSSSTHTHTAHRERGFSCRLTAPCTKQPALCKPTVWLRTHTVCEWYRHEHGHMHVPFTDSAGVNLSTLLSERREGS